jgi:hypothetical protein
MKENSSHSSGTIIKIPKERSMFSAGTGECGG